MKILFLVIASTLTMSLGAWAQNSIYKQNRFAIKYQHKMREQLLKINGSLILTKGESQESLLEFLDQKLEHGLPLHVSLDVFGGDLALVNKIFSLVKNVCHDRGHTTCQITTEVEMFRTCASACVPLFMVGDMRVAAERSEWGFHEAAFPVGFIPVPLPLMAEYVLKQKGVNEIWLRNHKNMFKSLKVSWLSPGQLAGSKIVTKIIPHPI